MIKFEDVKNVTTEEYFNNNKFSIDAFNLKYKILKNETYVEALHRVCNFIASVEKTEELKKYWSEKWFDEIYNDWWHPAGSIMQGAGSNRKISLANCTTISGGLIDKELEWDNLESIFKNFGYTVAKSAAYRQGLGIDCSRLRPRGSKLLNSANISTGAIHWLKFIDSIGYYVGQEGRIPAMLFSMSINHPDIEEFITVKSDFTKIQNANISVQITNDFYKAVENDEDWKLEFIVPKIKKGDRIYVDVHSIDLDCNQELDGRWYKIATHNKEEEIITKYVNSRKLLELLAKNMHNNAEPGIQNIDIARKYSNSDYVYNRNHIYDSRIISTNACSEQYLSRESLCVLASVNMEKFSVKLEEYSKQLCNISYSINRFLDNVNECELVYNTYATPHQKLAIESLRRTGAGVTNIGGWLIKQNLEYDSDEASNEVESYIKLYNYYLYKSSIELGKEKGSFTLFDKSRIIKSPFIINMMEEFPDLKFDTLRNITVSSIAPTGTLSLMFRNMPISYGIEPAFGIYYWKRARISGEYKYYFIVPNIIRKLFEESGYKIPMKSDTIEDTWDGRRGLEIAEYIDNNINNLKTKMKFKKSTDIDVHKKLNLMSKVMKWIDSSISVTYMIPENSTWEEVYNLILEANKKQLKSFTVYRDKKLYGIVSFVPFKELALELKSLNIDIDPQNFNDDELKELNLSRNYITYSSAPKRPKVLDADIYTITVRGERFLVAVGLLNTAPYEIFCGKMNGLQLKFSQRKGKIEKIKSGTYKLYIGDDIVIDDFLKHFAPEEQILFRLVSTNMRHGVSIKFIIEQLSKANDDITSLTSAAIRVLKKYLKSGESVSGMVCPSCQSLLVYDQDCIKCTHCSWSKCS